MEKKQVIMIALAGVILLVALALIVKYVLGGSGDSNGVPSVSIDQPATTLFYA